MPSQKTMIRGLFSKENIEFSLIFLFLSIIFLYFVSGPLLNSFFKTEIAKEISFPITIPSNLGEFLFCLIYVSAFTPYIIFIYKRKYETFILGFFIPSLVVNIYTYYTLSCLSLLYTIYIGWPFYYLISAFVLIYLLRRSKTIKGDLLSIIFFVFLNEIFLQLSMMYHCGPFSAYIPTLISFTLFDAIYLILLSFVVEKIAKVKIFRHTALH